MYVRRLLLLAAIGAFASSNSLMADVYHPKKVGIGTHDPTERLTLYAGNFALQTADNLEDQSILFQNAELDYTWRIYRTDVDGLLADLRIAGGLSPDSATLPDILALCHTGQVGIGTADPANRLSVAGDVDLSGSLGIGTTGPAVPLHVMGEIRSDGPAGGVLSARNPDNPAAFAALSWSNDNARIKIGGTGSGSGNGLDIVDPNDTRLLTITGQGRVGIGTTDPASELSVNGDIEVSGSRLHVGSDGKVGIGTTAPASDLSVNGDIQISGSRLHVASDGKVGIGTATPAAELHVEGDIIASGSVTFQGGLVVMVPKGAIIMWSGTIDAQGHPLVEGVADTRWHICDGAAGTPDLRDRFVVGAGSTYATGATGGAAEVTLTAAQLPSHNHSFSGETSEDGSHEHTYYDRLWETTQSVTTGAWKAANNDYYLWEGWTDPAGDHKHTFSGTTASVGGGTAHEHRPPYYALTFILHVGD